MLSCLSNVFTKRKNQIAKIIQIRKSSTNATRRTIASARARPQSSAEKLVTFAGKPDDSVGLLSDGQRPQRPAGATTALAIAN